MKDMFKQRRLREKITRCYEELFGHCWGGMWRNFYLRQGGVALVGQYGDLRLRDAFAVREVMQVLPLREMAMLVMDDAEARFASDVVIIARPDLFDSRHAMGILADAHRYRHFFHLGRYAFVNMSDGKCYWRARQGGLMRDYGLVSRRVRPNGHHLITVSGLSRIGTWSAAKACSDGHYLQAIESKLRPCLDQAAKERGIDADDVGFEVLVEVTYDVEKQEKAYLAQFDLDTALTPLITGKAAPPAYYNGPAGDLVREEHLMIRPVAMEIERDKPRPEHVVVALVEGDCPANSRTDPKDIKRFVVDGVKLVDKGLTRFDMLLQMWYLGPRTPGDLEDGRIGDQGGFRVAAARSVRCQSNRDSDRVGIGDDLVCWHEHHYYVKSLSQASRSDWEHVDMYGLKNPPPGLALVEQMPCDAAETPRRRRSGRAPAERREIEEKADPLG